MTLVNLIITLVLLGLALYLINTYIPMAPPIKNVLNVVVVLVLILWLVTAFGLIPGPVIPLR